MNKTDMNALYFNWQRLVVYIK